MPPRGRYYQQYGGLEGKTISRYVAYEDGTVRIDFRGGGYVELPSTPPAKSAGDVAREALRSIAEDARVQPLDRIAAAKTLLAYGGGE